MKIKNGFNPAKPEENTVNTGEATQGVLAEIGVGALIGLGVYIGKLLFDKPQNQVVIQTSDTSSRRNHNRHGYGIRKRKKLE